MQDSGSHVTNLKIRARSKRINGLVNPNPLTPCTALRARSTALPAIVLSQHGADDRRLPPSLGAVL